MWRFLGLLWVSALQTLVARLRRGPLRPSWTFGFEVVVRTLRRDWDRFELWPLARVRADLEARRFPSDAVPRVRREEGAVGAIPGEWVRPPSAPPEAEGVVLYLHGGSYLFGSPRTHADTLARVALATGRPVFAPEYPLAPEHPYPSQLQAALKVLDGLADRGVPLERVALAGESAGGNLVLAVLLALRDRAGPTVCAGAMVSPWLDLTASTPSYVRNADYDFGTREVLVTQAKLFAGEVPLGDPRVSVGFADPAGIAPVFVVAGSAELLFDECRAWAERARAAGVDVTWDEARDMPHAPIFFAAMHPEARRATDAMGRFLRRRLDAGR
ncbi:MAG: alpha/beta hydrolase fold domain-containing protein [Deltaproteobacteria bacterium]|nr:alpha/beta hydrolase fold domain-containing protein [Deltaproteobacteria bacterium]